MSSVRRKAFFQTLRPTHFLPNRTTDPQHFASVFGIYRDLIFKGNLNFLSHDRLKRCTGHAFHTGPNVVPINDFSIRNDESKNIAT